MPVVSVLWQDQPARKQPWRFAPANFIRRQCQRPRSQAPEQTETVRSHSTNRSSFAHSWQAPAPAP